MSKFFVKVLILSLISGLAITGISSIPLVGENNAGDKGAPYAYYLVEHTYVIPPEKTCGGPAQNCKFEHLNQQIQISHLLEDVLVWTILSLPVVYLILKPRRKK